MKIAYKQIDAFTDGSSAGNPAGYVFDHYDLTKEQMQKLATDLAGSVSEVVYLQNGDNDIDYRLRYFSQEREVAFCGHGTLAVINYEIRHNTDISLKKTIKIQTARGVLDILHDISDDTVYIHAPEPEYICSDIAIDKLCSALKIDDSALDQRKTAEIINGGLKTLLIPFISAEEVITCKPEYAEIRQFCFENSCDIVTIFSEDTGKPYNSFRTRIFAPTFGYLEDPATGSGNSALGYYLLKHDLWDGKDTLTIEQGISVENPNIILLKQSPDLPGRVIFGGKSMVRHECFHDV